MLMRLDWAALDLAFETSDIEHGSWLDRLTGEVLWALEGDDPEDREAVLRRIDAQPKRYVAIEPPDARAQWEWMSEFTESVPDAHLRDLLGVALDGRGAFRRFKDVLLGVPQERQRWHTFRDDRMREAMTRFLEEAGVRTDNPPPWAANPRPDPP